MKRFSIAGIVAAMMVMVLPTAAHALAPTHDDRASAKAVQTLPYSDSANVAQATTEDGEPDHCGSNRSVWYRHKAAFDGVLVASTDGSNYSASLAVYEGTLSSMSFDSCDWGSGPGNAAVVAFEVSQGHTYFIKVADQSSGSLAGDLKFSLRRQPTVTTTVDDRAWASMRNGRATVTGITRCSSAIPVEISVTLAQQTSDGTVQGSNTSYVASCSGPTRWAVIVKPYSGDFANGRANARVRMHARSEMLSSTSQHQGLKVRECSVIGTIGDDTLRGTSGDDRVCALAGDDTIETMAGDDKVYSGPGSDFVDAGDGDDFVYGDEGRDTVKTGRGADTAEGGTGGDVIRLGAGPDIAYGHAGKDRLYGNGGRDALYGGAKADLLHGGKGRDHGVGGKGRDTFRSVESQRQ